MFSMEVLVLGGLGLFVLFVLSWIMAGFYQKCGPNEAMVVSGFGAGEADRQFKIVKGGGAVVLPVIQQRQFLSLEIMPIEVRSSAPIITKNGVPIFVEGVAQVKVKGDDVSIATAAEQFLGKSDDEIASIAHETLVGHLRAMLGTMEVEELIQSFDAFAQRVQEVSLGDLAKMGLTVVSFTIKEIKDNVGYLEALGRKRTAEAKREADIGVAQASRDTQIAQAQAQREAAIAQAEAQRDAQIFQAKATQEQATAKLRADELVAEAQKNLQVKQAEYLAEVAAKQAASNLAGDISRAQQEQKLTEEKQKVKIVEAQKEVELQMVEVQKRQVQLEAEVTKPAEAEQTKVRLLAQAEQEKRKILAQADADATKLKAIGDAEAVKAKALADAEATRALGTAQAEARRAQGLAEASVIAAKGEAEAEAMAKKAEAFKQYNDAAMASMIVERLPEIVSAASSPLSKIGQMTVLATGSDTAGASKITADVLNVAAQTLTMVKGFTGVDLTQALRKDRALEESPR
ncbi:MAG TPA: SPFH domain-containing protein [Candidatus Obscuribacterales bacterium]